MHVDLDVLIIGAGISGLSAAVHISRDCPDKSFAVLEARNSIGGTWDLFRYPGIRSDSDMQTFGFKFKPWTDPHSIAGAKSIRAYIDETVQDFDLEDKIKLQHKVLSADWSSKDSLWVIGVITPEGHKSLTCRFLFMCAGYYSYENPHNPDLTGEDSFSGPIIHPQFWDEALEYKDKKVIVIGSGATAVTLIPSMAQETSHITMLQRSPTYIAARPAKDLLNNFLMKVLPQKWAYKIAREKNIWYSRFIYQTAIKNPEGTKKQLFKLLRKSLGLPKDAPIPEDYKPNYNPWEQRLCVVPDNDLFEAIKAGKADIVTGHIERITETGIILTDGRHLDCDIIIKATGINLNILEQYKITLDGEGIDFANTFTYEGMMFSDVPNLASTFGYINASWTLRADLISEYVCRLINYMDEHDYTVVVPRAPEGMLAKNWTTTFTPGYMTRVLEKMPKQGDRDSWMNTQDYKRDRKVLPTKPIDDGYMDFS